jgi:hypothetical protein
MDDERGREPGRCAGEQTAGPRGSGLEIPTAPDGISFTDQVQVRVHIGSKGCEPSPWEAQIDAEPRNEAHLCQSEVGTTLTIRPEKARRCSTDLRWLGQDKAGAQILLWPTN